MNNDELLNLIDYKQITKSQFNFFVNRTFLDGCNNFDTYQIFWRHFNEARKEVENHYKIKRFDEKGPRSTLKI